MTDKLFGWTNNKDRNEGNKGRKWPVIIVAVILAAAAIMTISGINKPHLSPFTNKVQFEQPSAVAVSEKNKAVVDSVQRRLLILDSEDRLISISDMSKSGSPINKIEDVYIESDTIYLLGYSVQNEGVYLTNEKVLTYDINGRIRETLFTENYDQESKITTPYYSKIYVHDGQIILAGFRNKDFSLVSFDKEMKKANTIWSATAPETICYAVYDKDAKNVYVMGRSGYSYEGSLQSNTFSLSASTVEYNNLNYLESEFASYSAGFFITNILYWISVLIIGLFIILLLIWLFIKKLSKKGRGIVVAVIVIIFTAIFYSVSSQNSSEAIIHDALISGGKQISILMSEQYGDEFDYITNVGVDNFCKDSDNWAKIEEHQDILRRLAEVSGTGKGQIITLNLVDREGKVYSYVDSKNQYPAGENLYLTEEKITALEDYEGDYIISLKMAGDWAVYHYSYIYDSNGNVVGILNVGCLRGNLDYYLWQNTINLFITLTCIMIAIIMLFSVIKTFSGDIKRMRSRAPDDKDSKSVDMCGMFYFLLECIFSVDSAIMVYVAKSLCFGMEPAQEAFMIAMPLSAYFAGGFLGCLCYSRIVKRIGERLLSFIACLAIILSFCIMIWAILSQNIALFIVGKLIEGFFLNGTIAPMGELIPFAAKDDQVKRDAINSTVQGAASAGVISILIGGILATVFSYQVIYVFGIGMTILLLLLSIWIFRGGSKEKKFTETKEVSTSLKGTWRVFLRAPVVVCLFLFLLPMSILDGYTSYLFPMYTAGAGISAMLLSNLSVFSKTITYGLNKRIDGKLKKLNKNVALILPTFVFCIGLVCFIFSPNVYWAIIMFLVSDLVSKLSRSGSKLYMMDISREYNVDNTGVQAHFRALNSALKSCRGPILSAAIMLGMNFACTVVGLVNGAANAAFAVYLKKRKKNEGIPMNNSDCIMVGRKN